MFYRSSSCGEGRHGNDISLIAGGATEPNGITEGAQSVLKF